MAQKNDVILHHHLPMSSDHVCWLRLLKIKHQMDKLISYYVVTVSFTATFVVTRVLTYKMWIFFHDNLKFDQILNICCIILKFLYLIIKIHIYKL